MTALTEKRLAKVKMLAAMFEEYEKSGLSPTEFCREKGIHTSKVYYWRRRYQNEGLTGLVNGRGGSTYKVTDDVRAYIPEVKIRDMQRSGIEISGMVEKKFGKTVSVFHVQRVLKELNLNNPVGRKPGKKIKKNL